MNRYLYYCKINGSWWKGGNVQLTIARQQPLLTHCCSPDIEASCFKGTWISQNTNLCPVLKMCLIIVGPLPEALFGRDVPLSWVDKLCHISITQASFRQSRIKQIIGLYIQNSIFNTTVLYKGMYIF